MDKDSKQDELVKMEKNIKNGKKKSILTVFLFLLLIAVTIGFMYVYSTSFFQDMAPDVFGEPVNNKYVNGLFKIFG